MEQHAPERTLRKFDYTPASIFTGQWSNLAFAIGMIVVPMICPFGIRIRRLQLLSPTAFSIILILGGADDLTVDGENGDLHHLADLVEEIGLYLTDGHQVLPQRQVVGVVHGVGQGVVIAENTAGPGLYPVYGGGYHLAAFHHAHTLTVQGHLVPGAIEMAQHAGGGEGEGHRQKDDGVQLGAALHKVGKGDTLPPQPGKGG